MPAKLSQDEIDRRLAAVNLMRIGPYTGCSSKHKIELKCHCGSVFITSAHHAIAGRIQSCGCSLRAYLIKPKPHRVVSMAEISARLIKIANIELIGEYEGSTKKALLRCHCGKHFRATPNIIIGGKQKSCGCLKVRAAQHRKRPMLNIQERLLRVQLKLISIDEADHNKALLECKCGNKFKSTLNNIFSGTGATHCGCSRPIRMADNEKVAGMLRQKGFEPVGEYTGISSKMDIRCYCGNIFKAFPNRVYGGHITSCGCDRGKNFRKSSVDTERLLNALGFGLANINDYVAASFKTKIRCHCGSIFECTPHSIYRGCTKSCGCIGKSLGEHTIEKVLRSHNCEYIKEWTRESNRKCSSLRYDFYLPSHRAIIEFNGEQHLNAKSGFFILAAKKIGTTPEEEFAKLQAHDKEKREWAAANGIPLLDINYDEIDQVEDKVWNFLMELRQRKTSMVA